jgi:hypothetical protein
MSTKKTLIGGAVGALVFPGLVLLEGGSGLPVLGIAAAFGAAVGGILATNSSNAPAPQA